MRTIRVQTATGAYPCWIERGALDQLGELISSASSAQLPCKIALISDATVAAFYANRALVSLEKAGFVPTLYTFPAGESQKTLGTLQQLAERMVEDGFSRSDCLVALGGGVTGDLAGFLASIFQRGIPFYQVPTTLLAMSDSSVGGKTAVDLPVGKNMIGTFWQPSGVVIDPLLLDTLPFAEIANGMSETIKHALIADADFFSFLESDSERDAWEQIIMRNIDIKAAIVQKDTFDRGVRNFLNLGHTFGHAIEFCSDFSIAHGVAVAAGMRMAARAAVKRGVCEEAVVERLDSLLMRENLLILIPFSATELAKAALADKKRGTASITMVFPTSIGHCTLVSVPLDELVQVFADGMAL